jgi:hypothetical protein
MARTWTLGGVTLPNPQNYTPQPITNDTYILTLNNVLRRQIRGRKIKHILVFKALTQSEYTSINAIVQDNAVKSFSAEDGDLTITARNVHPEIISRQFSYKGSEFRSDIVLELREVE